MELNLFTILEIVATISGLAHVYLLTREKVVAWPFGILTVAIYVYIFYVSKLYCDTILHVIYIFINTYGWYNWTRREADTSLVKIERLLPVEDDPLVFLAVGEDRLATAAVEGLDLAKEIALKKRGLQAAVAAVKVAQHDELVLPTALR